MKAQQILKENVLENIAFLFFLELNAQLLPDPQILVHRLKFFDLILKIKLDIDAVKQLCFASVSSVNLVSIYQKN